MSTCWRFFPAPSQLSQEAHCVFFLILFIFSGKGVCIAAAVGATPSFQGHCRRRVTGLSGDESGESVIYFQCYSVSCQWKKISPWVKVWLRIERTFLAANHCGTAQPLWESLSLSAAHTHWETDLWSKSRLDWSLLSWSPSSEPACADDGKGDESKEGTRSPYMELSLFILSFRVAPIPHWPQNHESEWSCPREPSEMDARMETQCIPSSYATFNRFRFRIIDSVHWSWSVTLCRQRVAKQLRRGWKSHRKAWSGQP